MVCCGDWVWVWFWWLGMVLGVGSGVDDGRLVATAMMAFYFPSSQSGLGTIVGGLCLHPVEVGGG